MIILVDNHSFLTPALVELLAAAEGEYRVIEAGHSALREIEVARPSAIVLGPGLHETVTLDVNRALVGLYSGRLPILGIDLGMHAIVSVLGGVSVPAEIQTAGSRISVVHDTHGVFGGLASPMAVACFCTNLVDEASLPEQLQISAHTLAGEIMAVRSRAGVPLEGIQFCPQSMMTPKGSDIVENFLELSREFAITPLGEILAMENQ